MKRLAAILLLLATPAFAQPAPEPATGWVERTEVTAAHAMVVAANPLAAEAGRAVLERGGDAVDALVAVQMVLNLVEPQSSGLGGGSYIVLRDGKSGRITTIDGRETAPAADRPDLFLDSAGKPLPFKTAQIGGRSVGIPGTLAALALAHEKYGRMPWARLFDPAIHLALTGFAVSPRLHGELAEDKELPHFLPAARLFYGSDGALPVGTKLRNPVLAESFRRIATGGPEVFYRGEIGRAVVTAVSRSPVAPVAMTMADLAQYRAIERAPVCAPYRQYKICGMAPSSSGGLAVAEIMALLARTDLDRQVPMSAASIHLIAEASRLAFADRNEYVGDPAFAAVPVNGLLAPDYLDARARLIGARDTGPAMPGQPVYAWPWGPDTSPGHPGTSQVSIVDAQGNAATMTTTIESAFGSHLMAGGFLLNNELTDFSFLPVMDGKPVANRVEPGKRPRSSMSPTLVTGPDGKLVLITGSPGGSDIIGYVVKTLVAMLDWKMGPQQAAALPNLLNRNGPTELEAGAAQLDALAPTLEGLGHQLARRDMTSGINTIAVIPQGLAGGTDPRREGEAAGY